MRLELLHHLITVVDEREPRALATAVLGAEAEDRDGVFGGFVKLGEFRAELIFRDVGAGGVENVTDGEE